MSAPVDTVGMAFPEGWTRFPLDSDEFETFVTAQRKVLTKELDLNRTSQRRYEILMQALRNDLRRENVRLVASIMKGLEDEAETEQGLLAASCIVSKLTRKDVGAEVPLTINTIMVGMSRGPKIDDSDEFTKKIDDLEPPEVVEFPGGQAVRVTRLHEMRSITQPNVHAQLFVQHFLIPLDEIGEEAVIVTFSSPSIEYARPLSDLFHSMMSTFRRFAGDGGITDPLAVPAGT